MIKNRILMRLPGLLMLWGAVYAVNAVAGAQTVDLARLDAALTEGDRIIETDSREFFKNVRSLIVHFRDRVIFEKYYHGADGEEPYQVQSQTKSVIALLTGIAIDKGFIRSEEEPVSKWFPDEFSVKDPLKAKVRIRDLLTMSAGFAWEEMLPVNDPGNDNMNMYRSGRWLDYALSRSMRQEPSAGFVYNSGCPMIVAGIIGKAAGQALDALAREWLFAPLGIDACQWRKDSTGFCHAGGGLSLRPADMLKIGVLVLNEGKWGDRQVVSKKWIDKISKPYFVTSYDVSRYGFFWWIREMRTGSGRTTLVLSAEGAGGQKMYIFPDYRLVVAFTEQNFHTPQVGPVFLRESILPAL